MSPAIRLPRPLLAGVLVIGLTACEADKPAKIELSGLAMGTTYSVVISPPAPSFDRQTLHGNIDAILNDINQQMSTYTEDSELMQINQAHTTSWLKISDSLVDILHIAGQISEITHGAFDVTIGPVVNLWGFGPEKRTTTPTDARVEEERRHVGYKKIQLDRDKNAIKKSHPEVFIDLSAIAKGYAVDRIAEHLQGLGVEHFLVEIGGELRARGMGDKNRPWRIGIEKPMADRRSVRRIIKLENMAMATSGDYRNFYEENGIRYSHTLSPLTGKPVSHGLVSVSVLHPSSAKADALATGLLVLGPERALALAVNNNIAALFIEKTDNGYREKPTPQFARFFID